MKQALRALTWAAVVVCAASLAPTASAGKKPSGPSALALNAYLYADVVDEMDTTTFYGNGTYCSGSATYGEASRLAGDGLVDGLGSAWAADPNPAGWQTVSPLASSLYSDGADCGTSCGRAQLSSDRKILTLDTRGTSGPRRLKLDFAQPCVDAGCPAAGSSEVFAGGYVEVPGLLNVTLSAPFDTMGVCSTTACPEAEFAFGKLWFTVNGTDWRVDWQYLRILRISASEWYVIANGCDGTQIAGLSELQGSRTRPKYVLNGSYKMPFLLVVRSK